MGPSERQHPPTSPRSSVWRELRYENSDSDGDDPADERAKDGSSPLTRKDRKLVDGENLLTSCTDADVRAHLLEHTIKGGFKNDILLSTGGLFDNDIVEFLTSAPNQITLPQDAHHQLDRYHSWAVSLDETSLRCLIKALQACDHERREQLETAKHRLRTIGQTRQVGRLRPSAREISPYYRKELYSCRLDGSRYELIAMRPELCGSSRDPAGATFSDLAVLPCEQDPSTGSKGDFANEADNDGSPIDASAFVPDAPSLRKERELRRFYPSPSGLFIDSEGRPLQPFSYISARPANKWLSAIAVVLNFVGKIYWKEEIEGANAWRGFDSHVKTLIDLNLLAAFHIFCDPLQQSSVKWFDENIDDDLKSLRRELHVFDISNSSRPLAAAPEAQASRASERYKKRLAAEQTLEKLTDKDAILRKIGSYETPDSERRHLLLETLFAGEEPIFEELPPVCEDSRTLSVQNELLVEAENMLTAPGLEGDGRVYLLDLALKDGFKHDILLRTGLFDSRDSRFFAKLPSLKLPNLIVLPRQLHVQFDCYHSVALTPDALSLEALIEALAACDAQRRDCYEKQKASSKRTGSVPKVWPRNIVHFYSDALLKRGLAGTRYELVVLRLDLAGPQSKPFVDLAVLPSEQNEDDEFFYQLEDADMYREEQVVRRYYPQADGRLLDDQGRRLKPFCYLNTRPNSKKVFPPAMVLNFLGKILWKDRIEGADVWEPYDLQVRKLIRLTLIAALYILADPVTQASPHTVDQDELVGDDFENALKLLHFSDGTGRVPLTENTTAPPSPSPAPPLSDPASPTSSPSHPTYHHDSPAPQVMAQEMNEELYLELIAERRRRQLETEQRLEALPEKESILRKLSSFKTPWPERKKLLLETLFAGQEPFQLEPTAFPPRRAAST